MTVAPIRQILEAHGDEQQAHMRVWRDGKLAELMFVGLTASDVPTRQSRIPSQSSNEGLTALT